MNAASTLESIEKHQTLPDAAGGVCEVLQQATWGDLDRRIIPTESLPDPLEKIAKGVNNLLDVVDAFFRETTQALGASATGNRQRRILTGGLGGSLREAALSINAQISNSQRIADSFVAGVKSSVTAVASGAVQIAAAAKVLTEQATASAQELATMSTSAEQASLGTRSVAEETDALCLSVNEIRGQAEETADLTRRAVVITAATVQSMEELAQCSRRIDEIVNLIGTLARQTDLLALNAAVEAARAGDQGKGFAVVASEVKQLSQQTSYATQTVQKQVDAIRNGVHEGVAAIGEIQTVIEQIRDGSMRVTRAVQRQSTATDKISEGARAAADGVSRLSGGLGKVAQAAERTSAVASDFLLAAGAMSTEAATLEAKTTEFEQRSMGKGE